MNLKALFETQAKLDADILVKHPVQPGEDRLSKKILALQVELGELANEVRSWKFWSSDQNSRFKQYYLRDDYDNWYKVNEDEWRMTWGNPEDADMEGDKWKVRNLVLEEYVDCLHFILSIGLELYEEDKEELLEELQDLVPATYKDKQDDIVTLYRSIFYHSSRMRSGGYGTLFKCFIWLGELLGFTWEQVETAYYEKNKINHQRQQSGY